MSKGAFNVSTGMDVNIVMNQKLAMDLCEFVTTIAEEEELLSLLKQFEGYEDGVPPEIFALATQCRRQAKISAEFKAGKRSAAESREVA